MLFEINNQIIVYIKVGNTIKKILIAMENYEQNKLLIFKENDKKEIIYEIVGKKELFKKIVDPTNNEQVTGKNLEKMSFYVYKKYFSNWDFPKIVNNYIYDYQVDYKIDKQNEELILSLKNNNFFEFLKDDYDKSKLEESVSLNSAITLGEKLRKKVFEKVIIIAPENKQNNDNPKKVPSDSTLYNKFRSWFYFGKDENKVQKRWKKEVETEPVDINFNKSVGEINSEIQPKSSSKNVMGLNKFSR